MLAIAIRYGDTVTVKATGGTVTASGDFMAFAIAVDAENHRDATTVEVTGGTVTASCSLGGAGAGAIFSYADNLKITGGTVSAEAEFDEAVAVYNGGSREKQGGAVEVTGGTVTASGDEAMAINIDGGTLKVTGGTVGGDGITAISCGWYGVAAYLKDTCEGDFSIDVDDEIFEEDEKPGMIVEVDRLVIPEYWEGDTGLILKAGEISAEWDTTRAVPEIVFTLENGSTKRLEWGGYDSDNDNNNGNDSSRGSRGGCNAMNGAVLALITVLFVLRKKGRV